MMLAALLAVRWRLRSAGAPAPCPAAPWHAAQDVANNFCPADVFCGIVCAPEVCWRAFARSVGATIRRAQSSAKTHGNVHPEKRDEVLLVDWPPGHLFPDFTFVFQQRELANVRNATSTRKLHSYYIQSDERRKAVVGGGPLKSFKALMRSEPVRSIHFARRWRIPRFERAWRPPGTRACAETAKDRYRPRPM